MKHERRAISRRRSIVVSDSRIRFGWKVALIFFPRQEETFAWNWKVGFLDFAKHGRTVAKPVINERHTFDWASRVKRDSLPLRRVHPPMIQAVLSWIILELLPLRLYTYVCMSRYIVKTFAYIQRDGISSIKIDKYIFVFQDRYGITVAAT